MRVTLLLALFAASCGRDKGSDSAPSDDTRSSDDTAADDTGDMPIDVCSILGLPVQDFIAATDDEDLYATAADFTVTVTDLDGVASEWSLADSWSGCETYLLISSTSSQNNGWGNYMDDHFFERNVDDLLENSPTNTQIFFIPGDSDQDDRDEAMAIALDSVLTALDDMRDQDAADWWRPRVHFVQTRARDIEGWVGDHFASPNWGVGIDRFQRVRFIGSYADNSRYNSSVGWFEPSISMAANEAIYYNFEYDRAADMASQGATEISVFDAEVLSDPGWTGVRGVAQVDLPEAAALAQYDSMGFDLYLGCNGSGEYGTCPAWDYLVYLYQDSQPSEDNPYTATACQPAVAEVLGQCVVDGATTQTTCRTDEDCVDADGDTGEDQRASGADDTGDGGALCQGYTAAVAADTLVGSCVYPDATAEDRDYSCNSEGTGYDDLSCPSRELGRWITTYHREGRWVHDVSGLLPLLGDGGVQQWSFYTQQEYVTDLKVRFWNAGKAARPEQTTLLFTGGAFNATYNDREPVTIAIPKDATKVELATVISGHGQVSPGNCAEFCQTVHRFTVNGEHEDVIELDEAGTSRGCMDKVDQGVVPNQYGTWWYGRSGWCPGWQVPMEVTDITDQVVPGEDNVFEYEGTYRGDAYDTSGATILLSAWLVVSR